MKKNNKGFIAISLIYSFFLIFLITLLAVVSDYAHNRVLLSKVKNETQEYLNNLAEFNPVNLDNRIYTQGEEITFGSERWQVIQDSGINVSLILNRNLTIEEVTSALNAVGISNANNENMTLMCLDIYNPAVCNYQNDVTFNYYTWNTSIVKKIVDNWFMNDSILQKGISVGSIQNMTYLDGIQNNTSYVRIPLYSEYTLIDNSYSNDIWYLTINTRSNGISSIRIGNTSVNAHSTMKNIRPVIMVKKSI